MNMEGWVLLGADRQEVLLAVYPGQDLVEADLSDIPDVYQDLYWHAPKTYLGDKVRGAPTPTRWSGASSLCLPGITASAVAELCF